MHKSILIVEDELVVAGDIRLTVERAGYTVCGMARSYHSAMEIITATPPGLVLLDIFLKGELTGIDLAAELNKRDIPFVYLSANCNAGVLEMAKVTQPSGFIVKPFREKDLLVTLDIARYRHDYKQQLKGTADEVLPTRKRGVASGVAAGGYGGGGNGGGAAGGYESGGVGGSGSEAASGYGSRASGYGGAGGLGVGGGIATAASYGSGEMGDGLNVPGLNVPGLNGIIGNSPGMLKVFDLVKEVGPLDTSVLILGESGTGKEGIANCIHHLSSRRKGPFVKLNCAALPPNLVESELFGHEKGAFTGAYDRRIGKFEQANGGTLFLDEIGEMQPSVQVKLLRVLQEREIERIGGRDTIRVNVRIIAATNSNLEKGIAEGKFRLDLYYRLNVFPVVLPPLRERKGDIPLLVSYFIKMYAKKTHRPTEGISAEALTRLMEYSWPGNVRELQNLIERSVLMSNDRILQNVSFISTLQRGGEPEVMGGQVKTIAEMERDHILSVLKTCKGRISGPGGAAALLNLPASTLKSKMKKLGIEKIYKG